MGVGGPVPMCQTGMVAIELLFSTVYATSQTCDIISFHILEVPGSGHSPAGPV
jgi:hypothetical protein